MAERMKKDPSSRVSRPDRPVVKTSDLQKGGSSAALQYKSSGARTTTKPMRSTKRSKSGSRTLLGR